MPDSPNSAAPRADQGGPPRLAPVLGVVTATTLVIGEVIGSGIFFKPRQVAAATDGYLGLIFGLWIVCGLINLCGALTMAELAAMMPHAGGNYVFLRKAYGRLWGFLWGWAEFWVIRSGAIAALANAMAMSLTPLLIAAGWLANVEAGSAAALRWQRGFAIAAIVLLAGVNIARTRWGGAVQNVTTAIKIASLAFIAILPWVCRHQAVAWDRVWPNEAPTSLLLGLGTALAGIMWAFDGWGQVTVVSEEIRDPQRNVPRALAGGLIALIVLYLGVNVAFHHVLPARQLAQETIPAAAVMTTLLGGWGGHLTLAILVVSTFGALNSNILVGPRVLFAVARDQRFLAPLSRIDPRTGTPALAIGVLSGWAILLIVLATWIGGTDKPLFDVLTDYAIFGGSIFYFLAVLSVFVLRRREPDAPRPYRTWGYPWVPLVFTIFYVFLLGSMFVANPRESVAGLGLIAAGLAAYVAANGGVGD